MEFTIATFNVFWLFDNEVPLARWGLKLPPGGLSEKIERVSDAILQIGPDGADIVGLQEVEGPVTLEPLMARLKEKGSPLKYYWSSETLDPFTGQNVAILSRFPATTVPVPHIPESYLPYFDPFRQREMIGSLGKFLRVDLEIAGEVLTVFNVHLKSRRGGVEETRPLRNAQAQIVRTLTRPRVEQGRSTSPCFVAILGDINDELGSMPVDILMGRHDSSYDLFSATADLPEETRWTYTFEGRRQQLDHILLNFFSHQRMIESGFTRFDRDVSDHDATWSRLDLSLQVDTQGDSVRDVWQACRGGY